MIGKPRLPGPAEPRTKSDRTLCVDVELSRPAEPILARGCRDVQVLYRLHGEPLGTLHLPVTGDRCRAADVRRAALKKLSWPIVRHLMREHLTRGLLAEGWSVRNLARVQPTTVQTGLPSVTVAVCTRDRSDDLATCLESLSKLELEPLEVLIIDNAPSTDATETLVRTGFPQFRYIREPRAGLDWARNRAVLEATGDVIAFTDDDCVVDPRWTLAVAALFARDPDVMGVTGLVVPFELETEPQHLFERYGGFGRGFGRRWFSVDHQRGLPWEYCGAGQFGTGANMAYRRSVFKRVGMFDPALDVGTETGGGGDLDMFFRLLAEGYVLVYEPAAVVRHRHRRTYAELRRQIVGNGRGFSSYLVAGAIAYPKERSRFLHLTNWWLWRWQLKRLIASAVRPTRLPGRLLALELWAALSGRSRYLRASRHAHEVAARHPWPGIFYGRVTRSWIRRRHGRSWVSATAVRTVDVSQPLRGLSDVEAYEQVKVFVTWGERLVGSVVIANHHRPVSALRLQDAIAEGLAIRFIEFTREGAVIGAWNCVEPALFQAYGAPEQPVLKERLPDTVAVSIIIATLDRPDDLRECLRGIANQRTSRSVEVVVVDNNPSSGWTPAVVSEFPGVRLVNEPRRGLSYARNAGILAASGHVLIATDDDVIVPPYWLERLVGPFVRPDVMIVTGNVLPAALETEAQAHFESYGGLGRGYAQFEVDGDWLESFHVNAAPTWELGATANAAFRASLFAEPGVPLMDEALGAGTPTGCSEDSYAMYRALKAHHTILYEPDAYLWHQHRTSMRSLRRQIYAYSKGHVAYHLLTVARDHDLRGLKRLLIDLPAWRIKQVVARARHQTTYPLSLVVI